MIFGYYITVLNQHIFYMIIATVIGLSLTCLGTLCLIPIVFKVLHTSKMVMALFGKIKLSNIKDLASKCDLYIDEVLNEQKKQIKEEAKKYQEEQEEENTGQNEENGDQDDYSQDEVGDDDEDYDNLTQKPKDKNIEDLIPANDGANEESQLIKQRNESESSKTNSKTSSAFGLQKEKHTKKSKIPMNVPVIHEEKEEIDEFDEN